MRKHLRTVALIFAHIGLVLCVLFLILLFVGKFVPGIAEIARLDFFVFDYFYLAVPLLALISGILLQIAVVKKHKRKKAAKRTEE